MRAPELRPYQADAIAAIREGYAAGRRSVLIVLATGLGKTVIAAEVIRRVVEKDGRALFLAHRSELLDQAAGKLRAVGIEPGLEQAGSHAAGEAVVLASVQTLRGPRLARIAREPFRLLVIDECHHATAAGYRAILEAFPSARVLGVTATPDRLDGEALGDVFEVCAYRYDLADAIRDGWLARIEAHRVRLDVDLDAVHTRAGDLDVGELEHAYMAPVAIAGVADPLLELAGGRRAILFAVTVAHAEALADALNERAPGTARAVSGETDPGERASVVEAFRRGEFRVLSNCALFTEGFDCPEVEVIAIARPTKSRALFSQMVGRGTRLAPGKPSCLVLDFVGNTHRHRLITPADILAGADVDARLVDLVADVDGDVLAAIDRAEADLEAMASAAVARAAAEAELARVRFWTETADLLGEQLELSLDPTAPPATEAQRAVLERMGLPLPDQCSRADASALIAAVTARTHAGLCTVRQARLLERFGIDARRMTFTAAGARIGDVLSRRGRRTYRGGQS